MGVKLAAFFAEAEQKGGGILGKAKLAMKVGMSADAAQSASDSPENVAKFEAAIRELFG